MWTRLVHRLLTASRTAVQALRRRLTAATRPDATSLVTGTLADLARTTPEPLAENALLRQQLIILPWRVTRPRCTPDDRALLVLLASRLRTWRQALLLVQPDTLLRWHRQLFRWSWRRNSRVMAPAHRPPLAPETIALIREMAAANRLWGAERIRTAYRAPRENALCERFLGSVRRECLDQLLVLSEAHLRRILREYVAYFNGVRPHQGLQQEIPEGAAAGASRLSMCGGVHAVPVLGGPHHAYQRVA